MQSVSSRIWTRVAVSISYDDNHYTTGTSSCLSGVTVKKHMSCKVKAVEYGSEMEKNDNCHASIDKVQKVWHKIMILENNKYDDITNIISMKENLRNMTKY